MRPKSEILASALAVAVSLAFTCGQARATATPAATRVFVKAKRGSATLQIVNHGTGPVAVQSWITPHAKADRNETPTDTTAPFVVTPGLAELAGHASQTVEIIYAPRGKALPTDHESVFWLDVRSIPQAPKSSKVASGDVGGTVSFAIESRIKVFYLPAGLPGKRSAAPRALTFTASGGALTVRDPTPYYVTVSRAYIAGKSAEALQGKMLAPYSTRTFRVGGGVTAGATVKLETINRWGGLTTTAATVR